MFIFSKAFPWMLVVIIASLFYVCHDDSISLSNELNVAKAKLSHANRIEFEMVDIQKQLSDTKMMLISTEMKYKRALDTEKERDRLKLELVDTKIRCIAKVRQLNRKINRLTGHKKSR